MLTTDDGSVLDAVRKRIAIGRTSADASGPENELPPPASEEAIGEVEALVGAPLPPLLKLLYAEANGGFGPGDGLLGLRGGFTDDMDRTVIDILTEVPSGAWPGMPPALLPLCTWGCAIYSFIECPSGRVFGWDPNPVDPDEDVPFFAQEFDLETWMRLWLEGSLVQPLLIWNEADGTYRGASLEETIAQMRGSN